MYVYTYVDICAVCMYVCVCMCTYVCVFGGITMYLLISSHVLMEKLVKLQQKAVFVDGE